MCRDAGRYTSGCWGVNCSYGDGRRYEVLVVGLGTEKGRGINPELRRRCQGHLLRTYFGEDDQNPARSLLRNRGLQLQQMWGAGGKAATG